MSYSSACSAPRPRTPSRLGALGPHSRRRAGCKRVYPPRAVRCARPAEQNPKKGEKGVAHSSRAPPPGHARPRGWAHWNRPRVVGQGVRGSTSPCRAPRAACGLKRPKRKKGGLRSQYIFEPAKHRRAPAPGHARPRGGARWNRPRVVGQGASGCTPSCRAPPRVVCGPKIKKGSERVRAVVRMLTKSVLRPPPGRARRRGVGFNRIFPLVSCTTRSLGTETPERG